MSDLSKILEAYGYKAKEEQLDIIRLIYLAGGFDPEILAADLKETDHTQTQIEYAEKTAAKATNKHQELKNVENFDSELILNNLFHSAYPVLEKATWPEKLHHWLLRITQREFFARTSGQERWQQKTGEWMEYYEKEVRAIIERLKLENEVRPQLKFYRAICPLGSTAPEIGRRLNYNIKIVSEYAVSTKDIYPLTGERLADNKVDGADHLKKLSQQTQILQESIIETHLMQFAVKEAQTNSDNFKNIPCKVIHTPKGEKPRPATVDTVIQLSIEVPDLEGDVLFISGAPNIAPQREDIISTLNKYLPKVRPEVVGDKCENVALNRIMGTVGGTLFGGYPRVAFEMGCQLSITELEAKRDNYSFTSQQNLLKEQNSVVNKVGF